MANRKTTGMKVKLLAKIERQRGGHHGFYRKHLNCGRFLGGFLALFVACACFGLGYEFVRRNGVAADCQREQPNCQKTRRKPYVPAGFFHATIS